MNILLIGNKPSDMKIDYSKYDIICQINRMNNIMNVPKVDMWYCQIPTAKARGLAIKNNVL